MSSRRRYDGGAATKRGSCGGWGVAESLVLVSIVEYEGETEGFGDVRVEMGIDGLRVGWYVISLLHAVFGRVAHPLLVT